MSATQLLKISVSWAAVLAGLVPSIVAFGLLGQLPIIGSLRPAFPEVWLGAVTLLLIGLLPLAAAFAAFRNRKIASLLYLIGAPLAALGVAFSDLRDVAQTTSRSVAVAFIPFLLLGYFWSIAHRYGWPYLSAGARLPFGAKVSLAVAVSALFCGFICATSVHIASSWEVPGDCGEPSPFVKHYPERAVFTARVVHVDPIIGAMAVVQQNFWGLHWWNRIVFLKFARLKDTYFVDGRLEEGVLTRWILPVLDMKCTGSSLLQDAKVELRLLRDGPRWSGVRVIGRVLKVQRGGAAPAVAVKVIVEGPAGSLVALTDQDGIYDLSGLDAGHYSIRAEADSDFRQYSSCQDFREPPGLKPGDVWGCTLRVR
jgi:hypothetical protein